jgi:hypothetical protein
MILNNRLYNILKSIAQIWLPALGTLIFTFTDVWGLSYGPQIVGTITAVDTFLGVGLGLSSRVYNSSDKAFDGDIVVNTKDPAKDTYSLNLGIPIAEIAGKKSINFRVMEAPESHTIT